MGKISLATMAAVLSCIWSGSALVPEACPRRAFLGHGATAAFAVFSSGAAASAYEFIDVGGGEGSATTKAMNLQAFETNNRLERSGVKLETPAEQSKSLSAALSEYSYEPTASKKQDKSQKGSMNKGSGGRRK
jgi:hypothetical protein